MTVSPHGMLAPASTATAPTETAPRRRLPARAERFREFQPDIVAIEQRPMPRAAEMMLVAILAFLTLSVIWASLAEIDRVVTASGRLVTSAAKVVVQPMETGVVRTLEVREGQVVRKGQVLATLDATFAEADATATRRAVMSVSAQIARLEAEMAGAAPASALSSDPAEDRLQRELFDKRRAEAEATLRSFAAEAEELGAQLVSIRHEQRDLDRQAGVARELEQMRAHLLAKEYGSRAQWLDSQNQRLSVERELNKLANRIQEVTHRLSTIQAKRAAWQNEHQSKVAQELVGARRERDRLDEELKKQERRSSLVQLTAPQDAVVLEIAGKSVGSVVSQAEPLITMVPADVPVELEVDILPQDIALLRTGDSTRIKLEALPYQQYGILKGGVAVLSEDTLTIRKGGPQEAPVYRGRIGITERELRGLPADFRLIPGMAASAEIKVGSRKLITYFLYPLFRALDSSFREP